MANGISFNICILSFPYWNDMNHTIYQEYFYINYLRLCFYNDNFNMTVVLL